MILSKSLTEYTRAELDALGIVLGIEPSDYSTKAELLVAVQGQADAAGIVAGPFTMPEIDPADLLSPDLIYGGDRRKAGTMSLPKVYVVDRQAYLFFGRPEKDHSWTDPDGETHVAKATEQRTGFAVKLGPIESVNVPDDQTVPE